MDWRTTISSSTIFASSVTSRRRNSPRGRPARGRHPVWHPTRDPDPQWSRCGWGGVGWSWRESGSRRWLSEIWAGSSSFNVLISEIVSGNGRGNRIRISGYQISGLPGAQVEVDWWSTLYAYFHYVTLEAGLPGGAYFMLFSKNQHILKPKSIFFSERIC